MNLVYTSVQENVKHIFDNFLKLLAFLLESLSLVARTKYSEDVLVVRCFLISFQLQTTHFYCFISIIEKLQIYTKEVQK